MIFGDVLIKYYHNLLSHTRIQISEAIIALYQNPLNTNTIIQKLDEIQFTTDGLNKYTTMMTDYAEFTENPAIRFGDALKIIDDFNATCNSNCSLNLTYNMNDNDDVDLNSLLLTLIDKKNRNKKTSYRIKYNYMGEYDNDITITIIDEGFQNVEDILLLISTIILIIPLLFVGANNQIIFNNISDYDNYTHAITLIHFDADISLSDSEKGNYDPNNNDNDEFNELILYHKDLYKTKSEEDIRKELNESLEKENIETILKTVVKQILDNNLVNVYNLHTPHDTVLTINDNTKKLAEQYFTETKQKLCPAPTTPSASGGKRRNTKRKSNRRRNHHSRKSNHRKSNRRRRSRRSRR